MTRQRLKSAGFSIRRLLILVIGGMLVAAAGTGAALGQEETDSGKFPPPRVALIVSRNVRPYLEAVEGIDSVLSSESDIQFKVFQLGKQDAKARLALAQQLIRDGYRLAVAIGPDAGRFLMTEMDAAAMGRLYTMVLNPENVFEASESACGISMNIPVPRQIDVFRQGLPRVRRIGLLYDPANNSDFFLSAADAAAGRGVEIIPLRIASKKQIPSALKAHWQGMDAVWLIPDRTVISESIVQYIIKEALFKKIPVIGYNRFFYESGAALAFVFDYERLGRQTGHLVIEALQEDSCLNRAPIFSVWLNRRVFKILGLEPPAALVAPIEEGP